MLVQLSARMPYLPKSGLDLTEPCRRFGQSSHVAELLHGAQKMRGVRVATRHRAWPRRREGCATTTYRDLQLADRTARAD